MHCKADMEKKHKDLLTSKLVFLVDNLEMPLLVDHMLQTYLLSDDDQERLEVIFHYNLILRVSTRGGRLQLTSS